MRRAQAISFDLILATFVFVIVLMGLIFVTNVLSKNQRIDDVRRESEYIPDAFAINQTTNLGFLNGNKVDAELLSSLSHRNYSEIKQAIGAKNDFCIYFVDNAGFLIKVNNLSGIGSPRLKINNIPCGNFTFLTS